ncbi:membrane protein [Actinobacillus equuli]|nr:membrane protein [Actinobacillus equuli]
MAILFADPSQSILANAIITSLFALSLPYQGLYWLGKRAASPLPLSLLGWYQELKQKLINENKKWKTKQCPLIRISPTYCNLPNKLGAMNI